MKMTQFRLTPAKTMLSVWFTLALLALRACSSSIFDEDKKQSGRCTDAPDNETVALDFFENPILSYSYASSAYFQSQGFTFEEGLTMTEHDGNALFWWETDPFLIEKVKQDSGLPYEILGVNRIEFNCNWPHVSSERVQMTPLSIFLYRLFFRLLFSKNQNLVKIKSILKRRVIDFTRPVFKSKLGRGVHLSFLSLVILVPNFNFEVFELFLKFFPKEYLDLHDGTGYSALNIAVKDGQVRVVQALLEAGADPNIRIVNAGPPAFIALSKGTLEMIFALASCHRCNPLERESVQQRDLITFMEVVNRPEGIIFYMMNESIPHVVLRDILIGSYNRNRGFALRFVPHAIPYMSTQLFEEFLLHFIMVDDLEALKLLLDLKTNFRIEKNNMQILDYALNKNSEFMVRLLAPVTTKPVLSWAIKKTLNERKIVLISILAGSVASLNDLADENGLSLPCYAAKLGDSRAFLALLSHNNFNPNQVDATGTNLVHFNSGSGEINALIFNYVCNYISVKK